MEGEWKAAEARLDGRINTVAATVQTHIEAEETKWVGNRETHEKLFDRTERPSWMVLALVTGLTSGLVGMIVFVATHKVG